MNKITKYIEQKKKSIKIVKKNKMFFKSGWYICNDNNNVCYLKNKKIKKQCILNNNHSTSFKIENIIKKIISSCFMFRIKNEKIKKHFEGQLIYLSTYRTNFKIFDYNNNLILTKYNNKEDYAKKITTYEQFSKDFNIPKIIEFNNNELSIIEQLIETKEVETISKIDYIKIINDYYKKVFSSITSKKMYVSTNNKYYDDNENIYIAKIISKIKMDKVSTNKLLIRSHGDLRKTNILIDKNNVVYFIDWELSNYHSITYDLFKFIQNEFSMSKDKIYLQSYLEGSFDWILEKSFKLSNETFRPEFRVDYLMLFFVELINSTQSKDEQESFYNVFKKVEEYIRKRRIKL